MDKPADLSLRRTFVALFDRPYGDELAAVHDLEDRLWALVSAASRRWPSFELKHERFLQYVAERMPTDVPLSRALDEIHADDLYLACACFDGDERAIASFDALYWSEVDRAFARISVGQAIADEVKQELRERLFIATEDRKPAISKYGGRGRLGAWVKVTAIRAALKQLDRQGKVSPLDETTPPLAEADPELQYMKGLYREQFKAAFSQAIASISPRQINLLRQHYVDGLTTYQLAHLYRVHQTTAARWLTGAREAILARTQQLLQARLQVDQHECESIMRLIDSRLDVTLRQFASTSDG